jgi:muramoyltetrapeptide carboxypeptidase
VPTLRKARAIRLGATIGIAAPAGPVDRERLEESEELLRDLGFEPRRAPDLTDRCGYLAGDDERRARELMDLVTDDRVGAILCARGGYGCHRIVSRLDAAVFRKAAKPLVGYSDVTTLLLWQRRCAGLMGFHGPMLERGRALTADARDALVRGLTGQKWSRRLPGRGLAGGWGEGRLTGGTLAVVVASLGTPWEIDTRGCILMLEEVNEKPFRIDRMLQQLHAAGKLEPLVGVGFGSLEGCEDDRYPEPTALEVVEEILRPLGIPIVVDLPFGHVDANLLWPFGGRAAIDGDRGEIELLESGVSGR